MAKARVSSNPLYTGGAGGYTFYTRDGEQIMRQRRNNSNYGVSASRTYAQQIRRIKWGNLVNVYKALKFWQPKAYDSKKKGQTDYNLFMQLNINSAVAALTKDMAQNGCAVIEGYQVSKGSLPPIGTGSTSVSGAIATDIMLTEAITSATTVGQLSADIIANNTAFQRGDNIAVILVFNWQDARRYPYASSAYSELTLDTESTTRLASLDIVNRLSSLSLGGSDPLHLGLGAPTNENEYGCVFIHTRRVDGALKVSSQTLRNNGNYIWNEYAGEQWYQECIATYGQDVEVPLDPSFPDGFISSVTANGAVIRPGAVLSGSQVIKVAGSGASSDAVRFIGNGIEYTPLVSGSEFVEFIITRNGDYQLYVGNSLFVAFRTDGISPPAVLSGAVGAYLRNGSGLNDESSGVSTNSGVLNYPRRVSAEWPLFRVTLGASEGMTPDESLLQCVNGQLSQFFFNEETLTAAVTITPASSSEPVYLTYDEVIVFVGNYS